MTRPIWMHDPDYEFEAFTKTLISVFHNENCLNVYVGDVDTTTFYGVPLDVEQAIKLRSSITKWLGDDQ